MVISRDKMKVETWEKAKDGKGSVTFTHFIAGKGSVQQNTNLLAEIVVPPGASIGCHAHNEETEFYLILEGSGMVNDNGQDLPVKSGDVMVTGNGSSHSLANTGSAPLKLIAVIIKG